MRKLPPEGHWRDLLLHNPHACVQAGFEGREGLFKIDTGAAGGVGGQVSTRAGVLERFELGGHEFRALPAGFALEKQGAFADAYVLGIVGGKRIEPFVLVFDYPEQRLGFAPRP